MPYLEFMVVDTPGLTDVMATRMLLKMEPPYMGVHYVIADLGRMLSVAEDLPKYNPSNNPLSLRVLNDNDGTALRMIRNAVEKYRRETGVPLTYDFRASQSK